MAKRTIPLESYYQALVCMRDGYTNSYISDSGILGKNTIQQFKTIAYENNWLDKTAPLPSPENLMATLNKTPSQCIEGLSNTPPGGCATVTIVTGPDIHDSVSGRTIQTWIFCMRLSWSGLIYAECITDQSSLSWVSCHQNAFTWLNGIPSQIDITNTRNKIIRECFEDEAANRTYSLFANDYGFNFNRVSDATDSAVYTREILNRLKTYLPQSTPFINDTHINNNINFWLSTENNHCNPVSNTDRYSLVEAHCIRKVPWPLPDVSHWIKVKVHGNGHVMYQECEYSVPYQLNHKTLWLKANSHFVQIFNCNYIVATHHRLHKHGEASTLKEHIPSEKHAWNSFDVQNCLLKARAVGEKCHDVIERLIRQNGLKSLKSAQGVLSLSNKYGNQVLENSCGECLERSRFNYREVKACCERYTIDAPPYHQNY
jgi:hypothetical protein